MQIKGVDISKHNGDVDFEMLKRNGIKFVMIGMGDLFAENVAKAEAAGMPWGAYYYTYSCSAAEDKEELQKILSRLKGKRPTYPIALDVEDDGTKAAKGGWNFANVNRNAKYILEGLAAAGYYPMLYTGFEEIENYISPDVWQKYDMWFAHWAKKCGYTGDNLGIWQFGGETNLICSPYIEGKIFDQNYCYKDYPTIIKNGGFNGWKAEPITENQLRQKVVNTVNAWLGAVEGDSVHREILNIYNNRKNLPYGYKMQTDDAWCAATVSAAWIKVGIADYTGTDCNCGGFRDKAIERGIWIENDAYTPKLGDAIIYNWSDDGSGDNTGSADHIGLVTAVSGSSFTVTEGNKNNAVGKREMQVNGRYIRGFIAPDYAAIAAQMAGKITPDDDMPDEIPVNDSVSAVQNWVNTNYNTAIAVDGLYGSQTKAALVKALQTELNRSGADLEVDGVFGRLTKAAVVNLSRGATGSLVEVLQALLICNGYPTGGFDGIFGYMTEAAVLSIQESNGLVVDGIAGRETFAALCG